MQGRSDADLTPDDYSHVAEYKWPEYFDVSFGIVAENRDPDPEAKSGETNSEKYKLFHEARYYRHGDKFRSAGKMYRAFFSARQSYVYNSERERFVECTKPGSWVYTGESEKIYCEHKLISQRPKIRRHRV